MEDSRVVCQEFVQGLKQTATLKSLELASCGISASGVDALCSFLDPAAEAGEVPPPVHLRWREF